MGASANSSCRESTPVTVQGALLLHIINTEHCSSKSAFLP